MAVRGALIFAGALMLTGGIIAKSTAHDSTELVPHPGTSLTTVAHAAVTAPAFEQRYAYAGGRSGRAAVEEAIDAATEDMNVLIRGIARRRLRQANPVIERLDFALSGDPLRATYIGATTVVSPADGSAVSWTDPYGDDISVSQRYRDDELVQRMWDDNGSRLNTYRFDDDTGKMTMTVVIRSSRLPEAVRYSVAYRRR